MQKTDATYLLYEKIQQKEAELAVEKLFLKAQFKVTMESMKPINIIKSTLSSSDLKEKAVDAVIGMTVGYLAKKVMVRSSQNPLLKLAGAILQIGVTSLVTKNPKEIKSIGETILKKIFGKKETVIEKA